MAVQVYNPHERVAPDQVKFLKPEFTFHPQTRARSHFQIGCLEVATWFGDSEVAGC